MRVKCLGGRELRGALRGYDELVNLVLDDCEEFLRGMDTRMLFVHTHCISLSSLTHYVSVVGVNVGFSQPTNGVCTWGDNMACYRTKPLLQADPNDPEVVTSQTRKLGLVVIRGTQVSLVSPEEGTEEIANPFLGGAEEEEEDGNE